MQRLLAEREPPNGAASAAFQPSKVETLSLFRMLPSARFTHESRRRSPHTSPIQPRDAVHRLMTVPARLRPGLLQMRMSAQKPAYTASHALSAQELVAGPPTIDISALFSPAMTEAKEHVVQDIAKAATKWGFFQVLGHGVQEEDIEAFDQAVMRFFGRDKAYKYKIKRNAENSRGYFDDELTKQTRDWKEAVDIGAQDGDIDGRSLIDGCNQWPQDDPHFRTSIEAYFKQMEGLSKTLCGALALGLGERADFFDAQFDKHTSYLRINHYPPCPKPVGSDFPLHSPNPETEGYLAINRHTDAGVLTVLRQKHDEPHSLQVFISDDVDKDHESRSGQWVGVRCQLTPPLFCNQVCGASCSHHQASV